MTRPEVLTGPTDFFSKKPCPLNCGTKEQLLEYFENTYGLDEWLFSSITDEENFYKCPDRLRLPLIFYYCHPAVVYINKLILAGLIKERVNKEYEAMFETGVDEMSWDDTENYRMGGSYEWPSLKNVVEYRRKVRDIVRSVIQERDLVFPILHDDPWWSVWMSIEHERIHLETSSVLIRQLPVSMVTKPLGWKYGPMSTGKIVIKNPMIKQNGSEVRLGKDKDSPLWGWDNEYGQTLLQVPDFEASKYMVTNRQMLEFVKNGGYDDPKYWSKDGWEWKVFRQARHPVFWVCNKACKSNCGADLASYSHCETGKENGYFEKTKEEAGVDSSTYKFRLMFDIAPLPLDWPVEVNYHEAKAFCCWMGPDFRLPTEAEEHVLRGLPDYDPDNLSTDPIYADGVTKQYNTNLAFGSSTPVNFYPKSPTGFYDTMGNVWEWVEDHFNGIPGFETNLYYDDFSTPCFDGKHTLIQGGSWITTGIASSRFARFAFRRHFIQHAGFRLARTVEPDKHTPVVVVDTPVYIVDTKTLDYPEIISTKGVRPVRRQTTNLHYLVDTAEEVAKLSRTQYSDDEGSSDTLECFKRIRSLAWEAAQGPHASRVLLVGCGTGRLAFELSEVFKTVVGCDTSARCIHVASELQEKGSFTFDTDDEVFGSCHDLDTIYIPKNAIPERIEFKQLTWIPFELKDFSIVINTMLDRVQNPRAWLLRMREMVSNSTNGRAIILSKEWNSDRLFNDFNPYLKLVSEETINANGKSCCSLSVWKSNLDE